MAGKKRKERRVFEQVEIIDTAHEGLGIGRCEDGLIIQVMHVVPGDVVNVEAVDKRKGMFFTRPIHFSTLSAERVDPFCSHFGICGGCKWQHMRYEAQLRFKEKTVHDAFRRIGEMETNMIRPIVGAPFQQYYRNKLEFTASDARWLTKEEMQEGEVITDRDGVGFHLPGAFEKVLDIQHCYLQADPSNAIRLAIRDFCRAQGWSFANLRKKTGYLRNIIVRSTTDGQVMVVLVVGEDDREKMNGLVNELVAKFPQVTSIYSCVNTKVNDSIHDLEVYHEHGEYSIIETLDHVRFHIGPKSFFQTNSVQAAHLYAHTKKLAALCPSDNVYDLYCGVGSLGLYMADACHKVVGIEQISEAIDDAGKNALLNNITNAEFAVGKVESLLDPQFVAQHGHPDVIITDPPRAGMHPDAVEHLAKSGAKKIVYVSCNPATQARDIRMMAEDYVCQEVIPVDMFPHTHHIESIALLVRR